MFPLTGGAAWQLQFLTQIKVASSTCVKTAGGWSARYFKECIFKGDGQPGIFLKVYFYRGWSARYF